MDAADKPVRVLMVCLGNICRSPTAEGVLRHKLVQADLHQQVLVDSAGTSDWHEGEPPDARTIKAAARRGYDLSILRSRPVCNEDFLLHDYILAMDQQNLLDLQRRCPAPAHSKLGLLLQHGNHDRLEVPDPYERSAAAFDEVLDLCERACAALLQHLIETHPKLRSGRRS